MKRREFNKGLAAATVGALAPFPRRFNVSAATVTSGGAVPVFSYPNGFTGASGITTTDAASFNGSTLTLLNNQGHNHGGAYYNAIQPSNNSFTTQFTWRPSGLGSGIVQSGMTFCINSTSNPWVNGDANMCGYSGDITQGVPWDSLMIKFDAGSDSIGQGYPAGGRPSSTGLYFNGGPAPYPRSSIGLVPFNDLNPSGISFYNAHIYQVTIVYDGSLLTMVILDTTTNAQMRFAWPLNLPNTTNSVGNYVGFTSGTAAQGVFEVLSWSYWTGYNTRLATPTMSPPPGQYSSPQTVTINYPAGSACYYTTNGLLPTSSSTPVSGPISVNANEVLQAVAIQSGFTDSLVATGIYMIGNANVINFPSGFSAGNLINVGFAYLSGSSYRVTDDSQGCSGAVWFPAPVTVSSFSTTFTLQWDKSGQGMCFVLQNTPVCNSPANANTSGPSTHYGWSGGPTTVGAAGNALGYAGMDSENGNSGKGGMAYGILSSIAIAFDQWFVPNSVGLYTNGNNPAGSQVATGLNFANGHPFAVTLTYDGTTLSITMTDSVTHATFSRSWTINIPSTVGGNTAYAGFTGGTGGAASVAAITSWTFTAGATQTAPLPVPAAPTNLKVQ